MVAGASKRRFSLRVVGGGVRCSPLSLGLELGEARRTPWQDLPRTWRPSFGGRLAVGFFSALNAVVPWHRLPKLIGAFNLHALRLSLREKNLHHPTRDGQQGSRASGLPPLHSLMREHQSVSSTICAVR